MSNLILKTNDTIVDTLYDRYSSLDKRITALEELLKAIYLKVTEVKDAEVSV